MATRNHRQCQSAEDLSPGLQYYMPEDYYEQTYSGDDGVLYYFMPHVDHVQTESDGDGPLYCFVPEDYYTQLESVAEDGLQDCVGDGCFIPEYYYVQADSVGEDRLPEYFTPEDYYVENEGAADLLQYPAAPEDYCQLNESEDDVLQHYLTCADNCYQSEGENCPVQNTAPEDGHDALRQNSAPDDANQLMQVDKQTGHTRRMIESMLDDLLGSPRGEDCNHEGEIIRPDRYNMESLLADFSRANTTRPDHNRPPSQEHNYTAFLEADHMFFTPWAAGNASGTYLASTKSTDKEVGDHPGEGKMMLFEPGSFFSYDIGKSKPNVTASDRQKGKQIAD